MLLRAVVLVLALSAMLPGRAVAADVVTLHVGPNPVRYGAPLQLEGTITPAVANETVGIYAQSGGGLSRVARTTADGLGTFSLALVAKKHSVLVAQAQDDFGNPVASAAVSVRLKPRVSVSLEGSRRIGARLVLLGRVLPRAAGTVTVNDGTGERRVRPGPGGRFHADLTTTRAFRYRVGVRLHPVAQAFLSGEAMTIAGLAVLERVFLKLRLTFFDDPKMRELMQETVQDVVRLAQTAGAGSARASHARH